MSRTLSACSNCRTVLLPGQSSCLMCGTPSPAITPDAQPPANVSATVPLPVPPVGATIMADQPPAETTAVFTHVRAPRRWVAFVAGGVIVALIAAALVVTVASSHFASPERTINSYFDALSHRDLDAALDLTYTLTGQGQDVTDPRDQTYAPLTADGYSPPTDLTIDSVKKLADSESANLADFFPDDVDVNQVLLTYRLGGQKISDQVFAVRPRSGNPFRGWKVHDWGRGITVTTDDSLTPQVAGQAAKQVNGQWTLNAVPGEYMVSAADSAVLTAAPQKALVELGSGGQVELASEIKPIVREQITQRVHAYIDQCAQSTEPAPSGCPFSTGSYYSVVPDEITWQVESYPEITLDASDPAPGVTVSSTSYGYVRAEDARGGTYTDEPSYSVSGVATVADGQATFTADGQGQDQ